MLVSNTTADAPDDKQYAPDRLSHVRKAAD